MNKRVNRIIIGLAVFVLSLGMSITAFAQVRTEDGTYKGTYYYLSNQTLQTSISSSFFCDDTNATVGIKLQAQCKDGDRYYSVYTQTNKAIGGVTNNKDYINPYDRAVFTHTINTFVVKENTLNK